VTDMHDEHEARPDDFSILDGATCSNHCGHDALMIMQWHVTDRCNLRCAHCYQDSQPARELTFEELLVVLEQYKQLLDDLQRRWKRPVSGRLNLTGGEPFVRRDFLDFLAVIAAERPRIRFGVLTNGTFVDRSVARRLRALGAVSVQVSVEGTKSTHDRIRGRGDFERTTRAVRTLIRAGVKTSISFTAHRLNYREFPDVARLARTLGAQRVWSDRMIPMGRGGELETLTPQETREYFRLMGSARDEADSKWFNPTIVSMIRALQFLEGGRPYECKAGMNLLTLLPDGELLPCRRMPIRLGNVLAEPLSALYFGSPVLGGLRDPARIARGCETCRFEPRCRGGLRCLAYAVTGDPFRADPGCWLATAGFVRGAVATEAGTAPLTLRLQTDEAVAR
jgi:radical SAM protein with 4Fe4S-binding SPASM domain